MAALVSASAPTSLKAAPQRSGKAIADDLQFAHDHPSSPDVNPIHAITQGAAPGSAEVHVIKVTDDAVRVRAGTPPQSVFNKVGGSLLRVVTRSDQDGQDQDGHDLAAVGPPPPSPPASEEQDTADTLPLPPPMKYTRSEPGPEPPQRPPFALQTSSSIAGPSTSSHHTRASTDSAPASALARSSTSRSPPGHHADTATDTDTGVFTVSSSAPSRSTPLNTSADGYLQPPSSFNSRPSRRHTTDSSAPSKIRARAHSTSVDHPDIEHELADDIKLQAEQIRREKQNRRAQQQREAEEALTRAQPTRKEEDEKVLVGNLIGEGHANYVLMYNMLTGIRIAVRFFSFLTLCFSLIFCRFRELKRKSRGRLRTKTLQHGISTLLICASPFSRPQYFSLFLFVLHIWSWHACHHQCVAMRLPARSYSRRRTALVASPTVVEIHN